MKYVAAYLLAMAGGKTEPTAADVKAILESVGVSVDEKRLDMVLAKFQGKNVEELIEEGSKKMIVSGPSCAAAAPAAGAAAAEEAPKEEEKEEEAAPLDLGDMFDF
jgi:large subunit ribosomal protein LP2